MCGRRNIPLRTGILVSPSVLLYGVFGAPLAWSVQELYGYAGMAHGCFPRRTPVAVLTSGGWWWSTLGVGLLAVAVALGALLVSIRAWRATRGEKAGQETEALEIGEGRTRFMGMAGILVSALFMLAILLTGAALVGLPPCNR